MAKLSKGMLEAHAPPCDVLIETGTQSGRGTRRVARMFERVDTIERDPVLYEGARRLLRRARNVRVHLGNSVDVLPLVIEPDRRTLFWLDAHFVATPGCNPPAHGQCPLLDELGIVLSTPWRRWPHILIDDAQMFRADFWLSNKRAAWGYDRNQWPTLDRITHLCGHFGFSVRETPRVLVVTKERP